MSSWERGVLWGFGVFSAQLLLGALASWPMVSNAVLSGACFAVPQVFFLRWRRRTHDQTPGEVFRRALREQAPGPLPRARGSSTC
jgi:hypothetical protein